MAVANITLNTKVYAFSSDTGGIITLLEQSGGIPTGFSKLTLSIRPPLKGSPVYREEMVIEVPVVAAVDSALGPAGTLTRYSRMRIVTELPELGTTAERTDFGLRAKDLLANSQVQAMLASLTRPG